jgi:hypothetical protein
MPSPNLTKDNYGYALQQTYDEKEFRGEYDGSNNLIYAGFAIPGTAEGTRSWQIKKLAYSGTNLTSVKWPEISSKPTIAYSFS